MSSTAAMTVAFFAAFASVAWSAAFAWARWLTRPNREPSLEEQNRQFQVEQRLAGIEQAVQTIASEVAGLVESQRIASRLYAERQSEAAAPLRLPGELRKADTPH
jgi:membrane protein implicated in regulation of membrane protease activity